MPKMTLACMIVAIAAVAALKVSTFQSVVSAHADAFVARASAAAPAIDTGAVMRASPRDLAVESWNPI